MKKDISYLGNLVESGSAVGPFHPGSFETAMELPRRREKSKKQQFVSFLVSGITVKLDTHQSD